MKKERVGNGDRTEGWDMGGDEYKRKRSKWNEGYTVGKESIEIL